ncbi:DUF5937 family protein [Stackebrandtia soli]|uniref:ArsR/SmtB family transcription factor n=1 Tax=Stackebrandtia soli TaxID=1892856 RepID=UPI0039EC05C9
MAVIELDMSVDDVANTRLARSPLWEVTGSLRVLKEPREHPGHAWWVAQTVPRLKAANLDLGLLSDLVPVPTRVLPAFLAPPPCVTGPDLGTELARLAALPPDRIREGVTMLPGEPTTRLAALRDDPERWIPELVETIQRYWDVALAPYWPRIKTLCDSDITYRARRLAEGGAARLFADLSDQVSWHSGRLTIRSDFERSLALGGRGLLLVPSVFIGTRVFSVVNEHWQPTVRYPPRGLAMLWSQGAPPVPAALAEVIGRSRAAILAALVTPQSTTDLALHCDLSPGAVSQHLRLMHSAGLVARHRDGRYVLYSRSDSAEALLAAAES